MAVKTHSFTVYYYNFLLTSDIEDCKLILDNWKNDKVTISKIQDSRYFITTWKTTSETLTPKIGNRDNFKISELKSIDIEEEEELYGYLFILIDFSYNEILSTSWWIISCFKTTKWEPSINEVWTFLKEMFDKKNCGIQPIIYKKTTKYDYLSYKDRNIQNLTFKVAGVKKWRKLFWDENKSLDDLFELNDILWWEEVSYTIKWGKWKHLIKDAIINFIKGNEATIENVSVDIDEIWNKITQKLDNIRFKDSIDVTIKDRDLDSIDEVKNNMNKSFKDIIEKIKEEYNFFN